MNYTDISTINTNMERKYTFDLLKTNSNNFTYPWKKVTPKLDTTSSKIDFVLHPIIRGLGTGILSVGLYSNVPFASGVIYGVVSGVSNIAFRVGVFNKIDSLSDEAKELIYFGSHIGPWLSSVVILHQLQKKD